MKTLPALLAEVVNQYGEKIALIEPREGDTIASQTYHAVQQQVEQFAGYLQQQGLTKSQRIMIWSGSRSNWLIAYFGALTLGLVVVPLDVNTKEDFFHLLIETTETTHIITTHKQFEALKDCSLQFINIDTLPTGVLERSQIPEIEEDDLAELVFTSGTTGNPKGVMLSHKNIISNAKASLQAVNITEKDRALSILPLSHMFEMTIDIALITTGASIVYARSLSPDTLFRLLATQKITCMVLVPQALQLFLNGIEREVRKQKKEKLWSILHKMAEHLPFKSRKYLFGMIHKRFGRQFRLFVCGGAHLPLELGKRWEGMGFRVLHGYGATECAPVVCVNPANDHNLASVGQPLPGVEVRITADNEIQVRGPNVALGYWKNPEATAGAFQNGWYTTGDLGYVDEHNNLYLKGRKKNLIVLANGMNVYPEDVENILQTLDTIKDAAVFGLEEKGNGPTVHAVLLMDNPERAKATIQAANKKLASYQQIKGFTIWPETDFPRTFTLKVKRQEVLQTLQEMRAQK